MRGATAAFLALALASPLSGCDKPPPTAENATAASTPDQAAAPAAAPALPSHNWNYREGQEYGYSEAISEDDQKAGRAVAAVHMVRFLGEANGTYTVAEVTPLGMTVAACEKPCQVVRLSSGGAFERVTFNPGSIVGAALTDAFNGQMELYGSTPAGPAPPAGQTAPATPAVAVAPTPTPTASSDPYAPDRQAEQEADNSRSDAPRSPTLGPVSGAPAEITHYACAFAPNLSSNPLPGVGGLAFSLDGRRACVNGRTAYGPNRNGGLTRWMLSDRDRRVSILTLSADRGTFTRRDLSLDPATYGAVRARSAALVDVACPLTIAATDVNATQNKVVDAERGALAVLGSAPPTARTMVWRCSVSPG